MDLDRFCAVGVIKRTAGDNSDVVKEFLRFAESAKTDSSLSKADYVRALKKIVPSLQHVETGRNLDGKM